MLSLNWEHRFKKFSDVIYSWRHRVLDSIFQRVQVIQLFALSRVYYVAAVLPLGKTWIKKFEQLMGKFIWNFTGKILRVSMDDIKNPRLAGGLQLPCISKMANALLVSQCLRALRSGVSKTIMHLDIWLGDLIGSLSPHLVGVGGGI